LTGGLVITSDPSGSELTSNSGEVLGKTPVELTGLTGDQPWQGTLALEGYVSADVKAEVAPSETKLVAPIKLKPQAQKVIVSSEPSDAEVVEDGKVLGRTPWESRPREVGVGVTLTLRKEGYDDAQVSGEVLFGKSLILQGTLKATPQKVIVTSEPTGAEVVESDTVLGTTPWEVSGINVGSKVTYLLRAEGYEDAEVSGVVETGKSLLLSKILIQTPRGDENHLIERATKKPRDRHGMPVYSFKERKRIVRTVAYVSSDRDHPVGDNQNSAGTILRYTDRVRSAAADWSFYPVGTTFRIKGLPYWYVIDDYVYDLVGCGSIGVYKPNKEDKNLWGVRNLELDIVQWGSFARSAELLSKRTKYEKCRQMLENLVRQKPELKSFLDG
jgi:3D (Asp-Asp-Asp) domain-containing protein